MIHNSFVGVGTIDVIGAKFEQDFSRVQTPYNIYQKEWEENVWRDVMTSSNRAADYDEDFLLEARVPCASVSRAAPILRVTSECAQ